MPDIPMPPMPTKWIGPISWGQAGLTGHGGRCCGCFHVGSVLRQAILPTRSASISAGFGFAKVARRALRRYLPPSGSPTIAAICRPAPPASRPAFLNDETGARLFQRAGIGGLLITHVCRWPAGSGWPGGRSRSDIAIDRWRTGAADDQLRARHAVGHVLKKRLDVRAHAHRRHRPRAPRPHQPSRAWWARRSGARADPRANVPAPGARCPT